MGSRQSAVTIIPSRIQISRFKYTNTVIVTQKGKKFQISDFFLGGEPSKALGL